MQHNVLRTNRGYAGPVTNGLRAYKGAQAAPALPPVDANGLRTYKGVRA